MKKFMLLFALSLVFSASTMAQLYNCNPDPNGEPYIAGGGIETPANIEMSTPTMQLSPQSAIITLPSVVDNSQSIYMPPIYSQGSYGCCVHAAEIWSTFTYEINRLRGLSSSLPENQYHPFYTYNLYPPYQPRLLYLQQSW